MFHKKIILSCFLICWMVLIAQFVLMLQNRVVSVPETVLRFFSFFTILTNVLVAVVFTSEYFKTKKFFAFFINPLTRTAVGVYIFVVGLVYNVILRFLWKPSGLQQVVDEFLHLIIPIVYILFWYFTVKKDTFKWKNIILLQIYPLVYLSSILILGSFSNYYPYPFIDVVTLGYRTVFKNVFLLTLFFGIVSVVFLRISKNQTRSKDM